MAMIARRILVALLTALALAIAIWMWHWTTPGTSLPASGGLYFPKETILDVPQFFQGDARWAGDPLGPTTGTLGAEGCAVASAAMVLASYGADVDPGRLNKFVNAIDGFTPEGWLYWEAAAEYPPSVARHAYEDKASFALIDRNLLAGNPVIVRVRYPNGITHFVVIVGKRGFDYLVRDPGRGGSKGVYPLKEFGRPIEALRFYERRPPSVSDGDTLSHSEQKI